MFEGGTFLWGISNLLYIFTVYIYLNVIFLKVIINVEIIFIEKIQCSIFFINFNFGSTWVYKSTSIK